jgi:hypothetical protein
MVSVNNDPGQADIGKLRVGRAVGKRPLGRAPCGTEQLAVHARGDEVIHREALFLDVIAGGVLFVLHRARWFWRGSNRRDRLNV